MPAQTHRLTASDGWPLAVHEPWPPPAHPIHPPLLAIHALALCGRALAPALAPLAATRRVLLLDMRGHGQSVRADDSDDSPPPWATTSTALWRALASDVVSVVTSLALHPCDVFAHSLGAGAAILAARTRPWRRAWLFEPPLWPLVDTGGGRDPAADNARFVRASAAADMSFDSLDDVEALLQVAVPFKWFDARVRSAFCAPDGGVRPTTSGNGLILAARPAVVAAIAAAFNDEAGAPHDADYTAAGRGLVVGVGPPRGGMTTLFRSCALAAAGAARARVVEVEVEPGEAGHYGPLVDPDGVGRAIEAWLGGVESKL